MSERPALRTYERLQELLYATPQVDLSVYRLLLDRVSHVAVLGAAPPEALARRITRLLSRGEAVRLPPAVLQALVERRRQQTRAGTWVEQHHRPAERVPVSPLSSESGASEPTPPIPLPEELAAFLREQPDYACVTQATSAGTAFVLKVPSTDLGTLRGTMPIRLTHELYAHPAAPVIRTVLTILDRPEQPLRVETFTNVTEDDQRLDFAALADQEDLLLLLYDEQLRHRLSKRVPYPERGQIPEILDRALAIAAQVPADRRDFAAAKAAVIERTAL